MIPLGRLLIQLYMAQYPLRDILSKHLRKLLTPIHCFTQKKETRCYQSDLFFSGRRQKGISSARRLFGLFSIGRFLS
jgi:hypothetical protein